MKCVVYLSGRVANKGALFAMKLCKKVQSDHQYSPHDRRETAVEGCLGIGYLDRKKV
ncbi:hypothetical protein D3C76_1490790 [compost metagenome]